MGWHVGTAERDWVMRRMSTVRQPGNQPVLYLSPVYLLNEKRQPTAASETLAGIKCKSRRSELCVPRAPDN